jgi:hypothetical protein
MHPAIVKTSQLILAGDISGAENELTEYAEQEGDHALVVLLDDVAPRDLLALMREYDASKESVVNLLVTPEQFAKAVVLEIQYGDRNGDKLRGMMNAVIHRDADTAGEYLEAIAAVDGGIGVLADYFDDRIDELFSFVSSGQFAVQFNAETQANLHATWLMERIEELDSGLIFGDSIKDQRPLVAREEIAEGDWMETAWVLRYELSDVFEELMTMLRNRAQKSLEAAAEGGAEALSAFAGTTTGAAGEQEESAI